MAAGIWSLVGVVAGWLLSELGGIVRSRADRRRSLHKALATLLYVHSQLEALRQTIDFISRQAGQADVLEATRKAAYESYKARYGHVTEVLSEAVESASQLDPILGRNLQQVLGARQDAPFDLSALLHAPAAYRAFLGLDMQAAEWQEQLIAQYVVELAGTGGRRLKRRIQNQLLADQDALARAAPGVERMVTGVAQDAWEELQRQVEPNERGGTGG